MFALGEVTVPALGVGKQNANNWPRGGIANRKVEERGLKIVY
jgi:hypothetical protein